MSLGPCLGAKPVVTTCQVVNVCRASASLPSMHQCLPEARPRPNPSLSSRPRFRCVLDISPDSGAGPPWTPSSYLPGPPPRPGPVLLLVKGKLTPLPVTCPTQEPSDPMSPAWGLPPRVYKHPTLPLSLARLISPDPAAPLPTVWGHMSCSVSQCL